MRGNIYILSALIVLQSALMLLVIYGFVLIPKSRWDCSSYESIPGTANNHCTQWTRN